MWLAVGEQKKELASVNIKTSYIIIGNQKMLSECYDTSVQAHANSTVVIGDFISEHSCCTL